MGHVKEPKGIDFVIESEPLTDEAREEISAFIRAFKNKSAKKRTRLSKTSVRSKTISAHS